MSDIVERLRSVGYPHGHHPWNAWVNEAAVEIERLREEVEGLYIRCKFQQKDINQLRIIITAADEVVEAARALQPGDNMDDLLRVLDDAIRTLDAAKEGDDE
jgi:hypothetical protein